MSRAKVGDRVGAILGSRKDGAVEFFGYGVYVGYENPSSAVGAVAEMAKDAEWLNPKIVLDDGSVVWGCESWWGPEAEIRKRLEGKTVVNVDINAIRAAWNKSEAES